MEIIWYALLGLFFATYFLLAGYDYGVGLLLSGLRQPTERRAALTALGPFFLGNEVWLVAAVGILAGAFPTLEGALLPGLHPAVILALVGVVTVTAAVQLRSRPTSATARHRWDRIIVAGSGLAALGWGAVLGGVLQGMPLQTDGQVTGVRHLFTLFAAACGVSLVALVAVHGSAFLALRMPPEPAERIAQLGRRLIPVALATVGATTVIGLLSERVRQSVQQPAAGLLLPVLLAAALITANAALARRRPGIAFTATALALAAPVLLIGAATWPYALVSTIDSTANLTVADAAASPPTLRLLSWLAGPLLPALLGFQLMSWWIFRGRLDGRTPVYW